MPHTHTHETDMKFDCTRAGEQPKPLCALEHCMILLNPLLHTSPVWCSISSRRRLASVPPVTSGSSEGWWGVRGGGGVRAGKRVHSPTGLYFQLLRALQSVDGFGLSCSVPSVSGLWAVATHLLRPWSTTATGFRSVYRTGLPVGTPPPHHESLTALDPE